MDCLTADQLIAIADEVEERVEAYGVHFARESYQDWIEGGWRRVLIDADPEDGDQSGHLVERPIEDVSYQTLGEWAEAEYSGRSDPTWMSGCGLSYRTLSEEISAAVFDEAGGLVGEAVLEADRYGLLLGDYLLPAMSAWREQPIPANCARS